jgi:hypothetical protein
MIWGSSTPMDDLVRPKEPDQDSRKEAKHRRSRSGAFWAILLLVPLAGIGWWLRTHCTASAAQPAAIALKTHRYLSVSSAPATSADRCGGRSKGRLRLRRRARQNSPTSSCWHRRPSPPTILILRAENFLSQVL